MPSRATGGLKGHLEMAAKMRRIANAFPDTCARGLYQEIDGVELPEIKLRTPVLTGALRASEHVTPPTVRNNRISVSVVAGGPSASYGPRVHEDLEMFHPRGGQAKFMESVLYESAPFILQRVARRIDLNRM